MADQPDEEETTTWTPPRPEDPLASPALPGPAEPVLGPAGPAQESAAPAADPPPAAAPPAPTSSAPPGGGWVAPGGPRGPRPRPATDGWNGARIGGVVLIVLGAWLLLRRYVPLDADLLWPLVAIVVGGALLAGGLRPRDRNGRP